MCRYPSVKGCVQQGCWRICNLVSSVPVDTGVTAAERNERTRARFEGVGRIGGIRGLLCALRRHGDDVEMCQHAVMALADLSEYPQNVDVMRLQHAQVVVMVVMERHANNILILTDGLRVLQYRAWDDSLEEHKLRVALTVATVRPVFTETLRYVTLLTILRIVRHQQAAGVQRVFAPHEVHAVLNALAAICSHTHGRQDTSSVAITCTILLCLSETPSNVNVILGCGGVQFLLRLLDIYPPHRIYIPNLVPCLDTLRPRCLLCRDSGLARPAYIPSPRQCEARVSHRHLERCPGCFGPV